MVTAQLVMDALASPSSIHAIDSVLGERDSCGLQIKGRWYSAKYSRGHGGWFLYDDKAPPTQFGARNTTTVNPPWGEGMSTSTLIRLLKTLQEAP